MVSSAVAVPPQVSLKHKLVPFNWEMRVEGHETGGRWDYAVFGEKPDASDGVDRYDAPKCPSPPNGYVRMYLFHPGLQYPFEYLWYEYRQSPKTHDSFTLVVWWVPQSGNNPTDITISWEQTGITEYRYIMINEVNMLKSESFIFTCEAFIPTVFEIICHR